MNEYHRNQFATLLILIFLTTNITSTTGVWAGETPFEILKSNQVGGNIIGIEWNQDNSGFIFAFQKDTSGGYPALISDIYLSQNEFKYTVPINMGFTRKPLVFCLSGTGGRFVVAYDSNYIASY